MDVWQSRIGLPVPVMIEFPTGPSPAIRRENQTLSDWIVMDVLGGLDAILRRNEISVVPAALLPGPCSWKAMRAKGHLSREPSDDSRKR